MPTLTHEDIYLNARYRVNLSVPFGMKDRLEELRCEKRARSINAVVIEALEVYLTGEGL